MSLCPITSCVYQGQGWGEAAGLGLGVLPPVPWDSPGSSLRRAKKKTVPAPQTLHPCVALDANLLQAETLRSFISLNSARLKPAGNKSSVKGHVIKKDAIKSFLVFDGHLECLLFILFSKRSQNDGVREG